MNITEVKVFPIDEEKLKAFVSIVLDGCFMVNDIKIIQGREGRFISMPSRRKKNGEFKDVAHPLNNETRRMIETIVLNEYDRMLGVVRPAEEIPTPAPVQKPAPVQNVQAAPVHEVIEPATEQSLEEVAEAHLRDSFWTS